MSEETIEYVVQYRVNEGEWRLYGEPSDNLEKVTRQEMDAIQRDYDKRQEGIRVKSQGDLARAEEFINTTVEYRTAQRTVTEWKARYG